MNMKPLKELTEPFDLNPEELSSRLRYLSIQKIDYDVYLPTKGINLQRDFVWTIEQKRELIFSMLIGRHIPHFAVISTIDVNGGDDILQIIDGKQRLSTMIGFYQNKFTIVLENNEYYFKDLPEEYQLAITSYTIRYYIVYEPYGKPINDKQKINWFNFINFAGTPQDVEHLNKLK